MLDDLGLISALEWQVKEFQKRTGIKCKLMLRQENLTLDQRRSMSVFRIFQETLTNVARHANATEVKATLRSEDAHLILQIRDNGKGITRRQIHNPASIGIVGMRERVILLGGEFNISGIKGKGTTVTVSIPLDKPRGRTNAKGN